MNVKSRVGQVWENGSGLIVLVVTSCVEAKKHIVLVLQPWSNDRAELQAGDLHVWEEKAYAWEETPSKRIV